MPIIFNFCLIIFCFIVNNTLFCTDPNSPYCIFNQCDNSTLRLPNNIGILEQKDWQCDFGMLRMIDGNVLYGISVSKYLLSQQTNQDIYVSVGLLYGIDHDLLRMLSLFSSGAKMGLALVQKSRAIMQQIQTAFNMFYVSVIHEYVGGCFCNGYISKKYDIKYYYQDYFLQGIEFFLYMSLVRYGSIVDIVVQSTGQSGGAVQTKLAHFSYSIAVSFGGVLQTQYKNYPITLELYMMPKYIYCNNKNSIPSSQSSSLLPQSKTLNYSSNYILPICTKMVMRHTPFLYCTSQLLCEYVLLASIYTISFSFIWQHNCCVYAINMAYYSNFGLFPIISFTITKNQ